MLSNTYTKPYLRYHHFASLASMLGPSPDWCVGVDSVNLCLPDCSWVAERSFDLFPWDAGTDSGVTYMVSCLCESLLGGFTWLVTYFK